MKKRKDTDLRTRLYLAATVILLCGLTSALLIYLTTEDVQDNALIHEYEHSKMYKHNLEFYGGQLAVLGDEFCHWFEDLWRGTALAYTVACIAVIVSYGFVFVARRTPPGSAVPGGNEKTQE